MSRKTLAGTSRAAACGVAASLLLALAGTSALAQETSETPAATAPDVTAVALSTDRKSLVLTGERLTGATLVLVGDTPIKVDTRTATNVTATKVTVKAPPASLTRGSYFVAVVTPNGVDALADGYGATPVIRNVTELTKDAKGKYADVKSVSDRGGTTVRLAGTGFTGMDGVRFGKAAGTAVTVVSDTEARVTVPAKDAGDAYAAGKVTGAFGVTGENGHGTTLRPKPLAYSALPTVTAGDATSSKFDDKAFKLALTGTNLTGATVKFGTKAGAVDKTASTASRLVVIVPAGTAGSTAEVVVRTAVGQVKLADKWLYAATAPATRTPWSAEPVNP